MINEDALFSRIVLLFLAGKIRALLCYFVATPFAAGKKKLHFFKYSFLHLFVAYFFFFVAARN